MLFDKTEIDGAYLITLEPTTDGRGSFARTYCGETFRSAGIDFEPVQCNISRNHVRGTLRGMHFQKAPHGEAKLIQCVRGGVFDAAIDLRENSPTFGIVAYAELTADNNRLFFIPAGCAHGFLTLRSSSDVFYYMGSDYRPEAAAGIRWNDPAFGIPWPAEPQTISERDSSWPDYFDRG